MFRFTAEERDICFDNGTLREKTYLAPPLDAHHVTTGYRAVGRYSLPCPHPARFKHNYVMDENAEIRVGTVEPQFGQSGGGVEVRLEKKTKVIYKDFTKVDDY
jgi:hypothetical protein